MRRATSGNNYTVASFFSGCGGFDEGFRKKGFRLAFANDIWKDACESFRMNHKGVPVFQKDIHELSLQDIEEAKQRSEISEITVAIGGPPCQCFTRLNNEHLLKKKKDARRELFEEYINKIKIIQPRLVLMENVRDLLARKNEKGEPYVDIIHKAFRKIGYVSYYNVLDVEKFNVPQSRKRVIFIASNDPAIIKKLKYERNRYPKESTRIPCVEQYLKRLKRVKRLRNHEITKNTPELKIKIRHIPPGGYYEDLPENLKTKKIRNGKLVTVKRYGSYLRRLHPHKPALTITNNYIIHPTKNRYITNREKALLHTFRPGYKFFGSMESVSQQIANAVPPNLASALAAHALYLLESYYE
ncbi:MAG: DNA cytosine methyltransferase [Nanoarchaeota archaeon]